MNFKYISIFSCLILIWSCNKEKECTAPGFDFTGPDPITIVYLDSNDQNMLDDQHPHTIEIKNIASKVKGDLQFSTSTIIGGNIETGLPRLHIINDMVRSNCNEGILDCTLCINEECELYITYNNRPETDTLNILIERHTEYDYDNCPRTTYYPFRYVLYHGLDIINESYEANQGGFIIRK